MTTPTQPPSAPFDPTSPAARVEELRERLRPRAMEPGSSTPAGERFALERVQALELQLSSAQLRERDLTELAVRDGNLIAALEARVDELADLAERAEAAERALFETQMRAETALRRAELMEGELMSSRSEVDRLRARVVELEASLRRALAEVGEASSHRARSGVEDAVRESARMEESAQRSLELADRLRLKVVDLESSLRAVMREVGEATSARLRAEQVEADLVAVRHETNGHGPAGESPAAEAEGRLADLEARLASLDERISGLSESMQDTLEDATADDTVIDLREPEPAAETGTEPAQPPASRWSEWRAT
jgi:chromosome segregation ATPase